jgi:hypothetical protein
MSEMLRRLMRGGLIGTVAALALAQSAGATTTRWFYEHQPIAGGEVREVQAHGNLTLGLKVPGSPKIKMLCATTGVEAFWNTLEGGQDETRSIAFSCSAECGQVSVTAYPPWSSTLEWPGVVAWPLPDTWANVQIGVSCAGTDYGVFSGSLKPGSGDGDQQGQDETGKFLDEPDSYVGFRGDAGKLSGANGATLSVIGFYHFGTRKHEVVTGELSA